MYIRMYIIQCKKLFYKTPVYIKSYLLFELLYYLYNKQYGKKLNNIQAYKRHLKETKCGKSQAQAQLQN